MPTIPMPLGKLFSSELLKVASLTTDKTLYRIYLAGERLESMNVDTQLRNEHPDWFVEASEPKAFIDEIIISEYKRTHDPDILTHFLATVAHIYGVPEDKWMDVAKDFHAGINKSFNQTLDIESMRKVSKDALH